jgi:LuxR family transcriptional regulator, quorum-sensing system regulator BjaR1
MDKSSRLAFDFLEKLESLQTAQETRDFIEQSTDRFGFTSIAIARAPKPNERMEDCIYLNNRRNDFLDEYFGEDQAKNDPVVLQILRSTVPYTWHNLLEADYTREQKEVVLNARNYGMHSGYVVPVYAPNRYKALVSFAGAEKHHSRDELAAARIFALAAHNKLHSFNHQPPPPPRLTPRERECLTWVAIGKTDDEIGMILGLSAKTIYAHIEKAKFKLNANNRTYAVVKAIRAGELEI